VSSMHAFLREQAQKLEFGYALLEIDEVASRLDRHGEAYAGRVLTQAESVLWQRYRVPKRRIEWLAGRLAAKAAFAHYAAAFLEGQGPSEASVLSHPSRAPYVAEHPELCLSISHSNAYAVAVIAAFQIGVDLEQIESRPAAFADTFFCPNELALLHERGASRPTPTQRRTVSAEIDAWITCLWSRKEAVSKFLQVGGTLDFRRVDVSRDWVSVEGVSQEQILLVSHEGDGYCLSLALPARGISTGVRSL
jgi:phosphopantetheinyl transferase (holo-ACP synthase)